MGWGEALAPVKKVVMALEERAQGEYDRGQRRDDWRGVTC